MTKFCTKCNQQNPADAAFCLNCASPLSSAAPNVGGQRGSLPPKARPSQKAIVALCLAIAGFFCCGPFAGIPAAIVGWMELDSIKNGRSPIDGKWMAMVGLWGGIAATVIHGVLYFLWVAMGALSSFSDPYGY